MRIKGVVSKLLEKIFEPRQVLDRSLPLSAVIAGFGILVIVTISMVAIANYQIAGRRGEEAASLRQEIAEAEALNERGRIEIQALEYEQQRVNYLAEISRSQLEQLESSILEVESDIAAVSKEIAAVEEEISDAEKEISALQAEINKLRKELDQ